MTDTHFELIIDANHAKDLVIDHTGGPGDPGHAWMERDLERSALEGILRGEILIARAALELIREGVESARDDEGLSWEVIGAALDMTPETVALVYGGEVPNA